MPTHSIEHILEAAARGVLQRAECAPHGVVVRTQSAVVRSLVHELEHRPPSDGCLPGLREQVKEEMIRLMRLMQTDGCDESNLRRAIG
jgi:hypothetical protein